MQPLSKLLRGPIIGLLVTKGEADFLPTVLEWANPICNAIYALVGDDESLAITKSYDKLAGCITDEEVQAAPFKDFHRQRLLEMAQHDYHPENGGNGWFLVLHGDEIWEDDPRLFALVFENTATQFGESGWDTVVADMAQFYLHPVGGDWVAWPAYKEQRMFVNVPGLNYPQGQNYKTIPVGISGKHYGNYHPLVKHHAYRNPDQAWRMAYTQHIHRRCRQTAHDWILERQSCYTTTQPNTGEPLIPWEQARLDARQRFDGGFLPIAQTIMRRLSNAIEERAERRR